MLKKLALAALLLPIASLVLADPNNPGDDNPGTTYITDDFSIGGFFTTGDSCFVESDFCTETFISPPAEELRGKKRAAAAMAEAEEYAAVACIAAAEASAGLAWFFEGGGDLVIARHGNHGAVHRIRLEADLAAATISVAQAAAEAGAGALAYAYAFASAESMADACENVVVNEDPEELVELCATAASNANANAQALAVAASLASSESFAASGSYGAAAIYNEVWAANIEKYQTALATGAGSFAFADAEASAEAFALAYADAFAEAISQACAGNSDDPLICEDDEDSAEAYALAYAYAYAEAQATALSAVEIEVGLPVLYKNENGIEDTLVFGPDETTVYDVAFMEVSCEVPEDPAP